MFPQKGDVAQRTLRIIFRCSRKIAAGRPELKVHVVSERKRSRRLGWIIGGSVLGLALVVGTIFAVVTLLTRDTRQDINLADLARGETEIVALQGARDATAELCAENPGCEQGYQTDHVELFKFSSREDAEDFTDGSSEAYQSNWIVINYAGSDLSRNEREEVQEYIDSLATSE